MTSQSSATPGFHCYHSAAWLFTRKERVVDSGLDYLIISGLGITGVRWGGLRARIGVGETGASPYADLSNPQSLNQYGYLRNNPMGKSDPD